LIGGQPAQNELANDQEESVVNDDQRLGVSIRSQMETDFVGQSLRPLQEASVQVH
jgi:hypothetical protein